MIANENNILPDALRKDLIRRTSYISEADRDTRAAFVDELARTAIEADRQLTQNQHAHDIPAGSGDPVWQTAMAHRLLTQAGVPISDSECFLSVWGRVVALLRMNGLRLEGGLGEPLRFVADRKARGEPVAWLCTPDFEGEQFLATTQGAADTLEKDGWSVQPLYDAPQPPQIPEGYKLVPIEPTREMESAAEDYWNSKRFEAFSSDPRTWAGIYAAMLVTALQPKEKP